MAARWLKCSLRSCKFKIEVFLENLTHSEVDSGFAGSIANPLLALL